MKVFFLAKTKLAKINIPLISLWAATKMIYKLYKSQFWKKYAFN